MNYNPALNNKTYTTHNLKLGTVYFYNNYVITEFNEGVHIDFENFMELTLLINSTFKDIPFGFISNRANSYSIDVRDAELYKKTFPNAKAYAIVAYSNLTERIIEIENHFFKFNKKVFKDMVSAINWVEEILLIEENNIL